MGNIIIIINNLTYHSWRMLELFNIYQAALKVCTLNSNVFCDPS